MFSCRCVAYVVATSRTDADVGPQLDSFYDEFLALAAGIELVGSPTSFSYTEQTQFTRLGMLSGRLVKLLAGYNQRFRFTYARINDRNLCFQIDAFMSCASTLAATVSSVLDNIQDFKTEREMPGIRWSMVAIPDPSSLFCTYNMLTNYPVWDCAIGSFKC